MIWRILEYALTVLLTYYLASFVQAFLHYQLGHSVLGRSLHQTDLRSHHGFYANDVLASDLYSNEEESITFYYVIPTILLLTLAYFLLPLDMLVVHLGSLALSFYAHVYLHVQYHLTNSRLKRFEWFRRKRRLHYVHHADMSKNFAVVEFFWDRVFGTLKGLRA